MSEHTERSEATGNRPASSEPRIMAIGRAPSEGDYLNPGPGVAS